jgi:hypothetical protein
MSTNKKRKSRSLRPAIEPIDIYFLKHGTTDGGGLDDPRGETTCDLFLRTEPEWEKIWREHRDKIMEAWIKERPGTRPWAWWEFDGPKQDTGSGAWFEPLPIPRQRIGGTGTPSHEVLAYVPHFVKGIPTGWVSKFEEDYYTGRVKDIPGHKVERNRNNKEGDFKGKAIDLESPPRFKSEASYLERHGLLTASEKKYIEKHPELMEPVTVVFNDEDD